MRKIDFIIVCLFLFGLCSCETDDSEPSDQHKTKIDSTEVEDTFSEIPQVTIVEYDVDIEIPNHGNIGEIQYINDSTSYWSVGSSVNGWRVTKMFKVQQGDSNPTELFSIEGEGPSHFKFVSSKKGLLVTRANASGTLWITKDGGENWFSLNEQLFINSITNFEAPDEFHIFFIADGNFYASSDFGETWTITQYPNDVSGFDKLYFLDENIGFIFFCPTTGACTTLSTIDGGLSWNKFESENPYNSRIWDIQMINKNEGYGSFRSADYLFKTTDGCNTWTQIGKEGIFPDVGLFHIFEDGRTLTYNGSSISYSRNYGDSLVLFSSLKSYETRGGSRTFLQTNQLKPLYDNLFILTGLDNSLRIRFDKNQDNID